MPRNWQCGLVVLALAALNACAGSTMPADFTPDEQELDYDLTADAGSSVDPAQIDGVRVPLADALNAGGGQLPPGFEGVQGMSFTPGVAPGADFSGQLNVAVEQEHQASQIGDGTRLYLYYAGASGIQFVDSARLQSGWAHFRITMLGYFIVAQNPGIPNLDDIFAAFAFADLTEAAVGEEINCWAVALNGAAPYTFSWNMGDGTQLNGDRIAHAYTANGAYIINVTAADAAGLTTTAFSTPITVSGGPTTDLRVDVAATQNLENPLLYSYGATVTGGTPPYTYSWDLDNDGIEDADTGPELDYTFAANGLYAGVLTVTDGAGETSEDDFVSDARTLVLAVSPVAGIAPLSAGFTIDALGFAAGDNVALDFGDNATDAVTINTGQTTYQVTHGYASGMYSAMATGVSHLGITDYSIDSNQVMVESIAMPARPVVQLTQPILPLVDETFDILGYAFGESQGTKTVMLDTTQLAVNSWSDTVINVDHPATFNGNAGVLTVVDPVEGASNPITVTLNENGLPAGIQNVLPLKPEPGGNVFIIGHGFGDTVQSVAAGGSAATIPEWGNYAIVAQLSAGQATGLQTLAVNIGAGAPDLTRDVEVVSPSTIPYPILTGANPPLQEIGIGATMELSGTSFSDGYGGLVFGAEFVFPITSWNDTLISIGDPPNNIDGGVVVISRDRPSNPLIATYVRRPVISSVIPEFGATGDQISINGAFFSIQRPGDRVTLGGTALATTSWTDIRIDFTLPAGASDGDIVVEKALSSNAVPFDVVPLTPGTPGGEQL